MLQTWCENSSATGARGASQAWLIRTRSDTEEVWGVRAGASSEEPHLCAGRPHGTPRNLDIEAALGILFSAEGGVVVWLPTGLPVAHSLPDGLQDAAERRQLRKLPAGNLCMNTHTHTETQKASLVSYECNNTPRNVAGKNVLEGPDM